MIVVLLQNQRIAKDGLDVRWYQEGQEIDLPQALAEGLIRDGLAKEPSDVVEPQPRLIEEPAGEISPEAVESAQAEDAKRPVKAAGKREYR
jgi:hypothetical protein